MRTDPAASLNVDSRSLDALRNEASRNPNAAAKQAAVQFESLFMQMVVKSMRDATPKTDPSQGGDTFTGMLDTQLSKQFAGRPGGLADMIERQLTRHMQNLPAVSPENLPAAGSGAAAAPAATSTRSGVATGAGAAPAVGVADLALAPARFERGLAEDERGRHAGLALGFAGVRQQLLDEFGLARAGGGRCANGGRGACA